MAHDHPAAGQNNPRHLAAYPARVPLPDHDRISPWEAAHWRAFGHRRYAGVLKRRSFDQGTIKLPNESGRQHQRRIQLHQLLDAGEEEVRNLLASGRVTSKGRPPARDRSGELMLNPGVGHDNIPESAYFRRDLQFGALGELQVRLPTLDLLFPDLQIRGTDASPEVPLYYDVQIPTAQLRAIWEAADPAVSVVNAQQSLSQGGDANAAKLSPAIFVPEGPEDCAAPQVKAASWMKANVLEYRPKQRDARVKECMAACRVPKRAAIYGWGQLPESIKGRSRKPI